MRCAIISILIVFFSLPATVATAEELTAAGVINEIKVLGPRAVIDKLCNSDDKHPNDWDRMIEKMGTGDQDWLEVANLLKPASDAGVSEDLNGALAVALVKRPAAVLSLAQSGPFSVSDVCICPYVDETPDEKVMAENHLDEAESALFAMKIPGDNPSLDNVRRNCLEIIQGIKRGDYRKNWEERPPPNERRVELDRDTEFQYLLASIEAGADESLRAFRNMHPIKDPIKKGLLERAVARALPNNSLGILAMVEDGYVGITTVCRSPYDDKASSLKHLNRSEGILRAAIISGDDPKLATIRLNCLSEIRTSIKSIEEHQ